MILRIIILFTLGWQSIFAGAQTYEKFTVSPDIEVIKLSDNAYIHVSEQEMGNWGRVSSNGLIVVNQGKAFLLDTPANNEQTETLVNWMTDSLHLQLVGFIPNHWHDDCLGGLDYLQQKGVKSYANQMTIEIAKEKGLPVPEVGFRDSLSLQLGNLTLECAYLGGGHSSDNIIVWIPQEKILFAGCMLKDTTWTILGNLSDAVIEEWPETIDKVLDRYSTAEIVIPGHGQFGGMEIVRHMKELLKKNL